MAHTKKSSPFTRGQCLEVTVLERKRKLLLCRETKVEAATPFKLFFPGTRVRDISAGQPIKVQIIERLSSWIFSANLLTKEPGEGVKNPKKAVRAYRKKTWLTKRELASAENLIRKAHGLECDFHPELLAHTRTLPDSISPEEYSRRKDARSFCFVTIDGEDARDFDDAICVEKNGANFRLLVAIADVAHFVPRAENFSSLCLDNEALKRGNSFYFPSSVVPMLPPRLSTDLCSLRAGCDRLVLLCEITLSGSGVPIFSSFSEAVIRSRARLSYDQVRKLMACDQECTADLLALKDGAEILAMLEKASVLAEILETRRDQEGRLCISRPEPRYVLSHEGSLTELGFLSHHKAHKLIEEFMITANEACARYLSSRGLSFLYRVHPAPAVEGLRTLASALPLVDPSLKASEKLKTNEISHLLRKYRAGPSEARVMDLVLRILPKAFYSPSNLGHFGLASECYCHFTSPIRRYSDLTVHRVLKYALGNRRGQVLDQKKLVRIARWINQQERLSVAVEREIQKYISCLLMASRTGERFQCRVTATSSFGLFVQICDLPVEGLIERDNLRGGPYIQDPFHQISLNPRTLKGFVAGDLLPVRLVLADPHRLHLNFKPDWENGFSPRKLPADLLSSAGRLLGRP